MAVGNRAWLKKQRLEEWMIKKIVKAEREVPRRPSPRD